MLTLKKAYFTDGDEYPIIQSQSNDFVRPFQMIRFSDRKDASLNDTICFYEWDDRFKHKLEDGNLERLLPSLKRAGSVVQPDFSIYADAPLLEQKWAVYQKNRVSVELQSQGLEIIPNLSWGDERSYEFAFQGIPQNQICAMGTYGQIKDPEKRRLFKNGLGIALETTKPKMVLVYGSMPKDIFGPYEEQIEFYRYPCWQEFYAKRAG